ncbi:MAG: hypothetical protein LBT47_07550 [Deltaproteobacteria bacterium]|nr:hypothetical protein [Deltaproteobacteria bacterium]
MNYKPAFPYLVREMVEMGRSPHRRTLPVLSKSDRRAVEFALERVGWQDLAEENYNHLFGGAAAVGPSGLGSGPASLIDVCRRGVKRR